MSHLKSKLGSAKTLHSQTREVINNVYTFMKSEMEIGIPRNLKQVQKRVAEATGVSERSVRNIIKESKNFETRDSASFSTPGKKRPKSVKKCELDDFDKCVVRNTIHNFHKTNNERPTMKKIHRKIVDGINFKGSITTLTRIVRSMGFRWRKTEDCRKILIERHDIRLQRMKYLNNIKRYRNEGRPIVYTDETYVHSSHTKPSSWSDGTEHGLKTPISKGKRLIVVHAGSNQGFIPNALLVFKSNQTTGDYHHDMNNMNFEKWLVDKLIPNLPPNSVLVMDNAPYHNVQLDRAPTSASRKKDMLDWLTEKGIPYRSEMFKPELYDLIKINKHRFKTFKIDRLLAKFGHTVLRLPPYHPDLNPIENIWALVKDHVAQKNVTFRLEDARTLLEEKIASIGAEEWSARCLHAIRIENNYIESDHIIDNASERIVISLGNESETSDSDNIHNSSSDDEGNDMSGIEPLNEDIQLLNATRI